MSYFLFVDESGIDGSPPYEVLAGLAIEDKELWNLILAIHSLEESFFGKRMSSGSLELKGRKLLKAKTFRLASRMGEIDPERRRRLTFSCLSKGVNKVPSTPEELTALAQTKVAFADEVLATCARFRAKAFACIVDKDAPRPDSKDALWKNYSYLFERYFYFLEDNNAMGAVIFDELEKSQCHVLVILTRLENSGVCSPNLNQAWHDWDLLPEIQSGLGIIRWRNIFFKPPRERRVLHG